MIEFVTGDLLVADVEALVNPVNCVGVMGAGLARQFKERYPLNFEVYYRWCLLGKLCPGVICDYKTGLKRNPKWIYNFPTRRHWKEKSNLQDIELGLIALVTEVKLNGVESIAIPALGCGLGGLQWEDVKELIENAFKILPGVKVLVYLPS